MNSHLALTLSIYTKQLFSKEVAATFKYTNQYDVEEQIKVVLQEELANAMALINQCASPSKFEAVYFDRIKHYLKEANQAHGIIKVEFVDEFKRLQEETLFIEELGREKIRLKFYFNQIPYFITLFNKDVFKQETLSMQEREQYNTEYSQVNTLLGNFTC